MVVKKGGKLARQCTGVFNMIDECKHGASQMEKAVFYTLALRSTAGTVATRALDRGPSAPISLALGTLCAE